MRTSREQRERAFTLLEALLAAVVLAIAITAVVMPFTIGMRTQMVEARQSLAVPLAEELMEEILLKPFEEPDDGDDQAEPPTAFGPDAGEVSRDRFSAIDDYHGYTDPPGTITDPAGDAIGGAAAAGLSRHVTVAYVYVTGQDPGGPPTFMRVVVQVRHESEPLITLTRLIHWLS
jgi:MSHA pilin protein MshD